jgi:hypothetical protein
MPKNNLGGLDNKALAKLAIAIATAIQLKNSGEVIGPLTRKVLETLDTIDGLDHFVNHAPRKRPNK